MISQIKAEADARSSSQIKISNAWDAWLIYDFRRTRDHASGAGAGSQGYSEERRMSALGPRFHEIGTQAPHQVWIALNRRSALPRMTCPKIQVVRFSGESLTAGIEEHDIVGVRVRI